MPIARIAVISEIPVIGFGLKTLLTNYFKGYVVDIFSEINSFREARVEKSYRLILVSVSEWKKCRRQGRCQHGAATTPVIGIHTHWEEQSDEPEFWDTIQPLESERQLFKKFAFWHNTWLQKPVDPIQNSELSPREINVLKLVAMGMTNREIAEKLFLSPHTIITHRKNITSKLGIHTVSGLTVYAIINEIVDLSDINE